MDIKFDLTYILTLARTSYFAILDRTWGVATPGSFAL